MVESEYFTWLRARGLSPKTIGMYAVYHRRLTKLAPTLSDINQKTIDKFIIHNPNLVCRAFLRSHREWLIREYDSDDIRKIDIPKLRTPSRPTPKYITAQQVKDLVGYMNTEGSKLMLLLTFWCGLRAFELLSIKISDFNWDEWKEDETKSGLLKIHGKHGKNSYVMVRAGVMKRLRTWLNTDYIKTMSSNDTIVTKENILFPINYRRWIRMVKARSLECFGFTIEPHTLRHSIATHLLIKQRWDVSYVKEFLRHSDIGTTMIYVTIPQKQLVDLYEQID